MTSFIDSLVPQAVKKLIPYQSARRIGGDGRVWLNANELESSLFPGEASHNRYPDFLPQDIAKAYQAYCGTDVATVAVRGADEAIDLLIRTFCKPASDNILICSPTYAMYEFCADALAINTLDSPLQEDFSLNVTDIVNKAKLANIVFLCSPNNPTGNVIPKSDLIQVLEGTIGKSLVVVDEAYIEFEPQTSAVSLIERYSHLVVIRTLSKAFGLAAVRCGFILASQNVMQYVAKLIPPYPMPDCSSKIVLDALSDERVSVMQDATQKLVELRNWFACELTQFDFIESVYPSSTNFILLRQKPGHQVFSVLAKDGIVTRNQNHEPALRNCVRISIGSQESMLEVITSLTRYQTELEKNQQGKQIQQSQHKETQSQLDKDHI
ncbi:MULTISPECIES: histidinol-phosphate transaminase [unclassified Vibrio]|uniref:histidinol-phosphate transaminase n=1 Tax=unclassified Vibrio TaxID=2614977 RepID=UPI000C833A12|nr:MULTISPECIES: histidinol-phosphate transaminase [unclassified Vibrio]PMI89425.1 histidinol-phosphate transaminase [Vibrio sp. 10N.286.45.E10]PTP08456.1 histidinol-phosphate transaminase [Vibrio sp. 10N.286.45.A3]PTQ24787.1 histidinol-phosphate transaminase [Vibrio sp. 10N.286.46.E10]TKE85690.1 histidinol-phosphate transaminase [Vibrio sp. F12]TKF01113.1 histidinol-phosphate transaminase [Vibrio sp. F12]